jgi:putative ABC transport system permease protein
MIEMRKSLWGMALSLLNANWRLISFSIISIICSTLLVITMLMYSLQAQHSMEQSFREMFGEADIMVSYSQEHPDLLTKEKVDRIVSLSGIKQSSYVLSRFLHIDELNMPVWTVGTISNDLTRSTYKFTSDITPITIILNRELAEYLDVSVNDEVSIEGIVLRVTEIIEDTQGAISIAIIHYDHMRPFMAEGEYASGLMLKLADGTDALSIVQKIREIDSELRVDLLEQNELVLSNMRTLHTYIVVMSLLVLVITTLLILSNLEIYLYKIRNQIAILRSIGATTLQISRIIHIQSLMINLFGTVIGGVLSILAMKDLFRFAKLAFHMPATVEHASTMPVLIITIACFIFYQLFMLIPVYRSTKILPLKIAEENERLDFKQKKNQRLRGWGAASIGIVVYFVGYMNENYLMFFLGLLFLLIGCLLLMPYLVERVIQGSLKVIGRRLGQLVYLTFKNMLPQVRRNAFTVISISLTIAIAVFGSSLLSTLDENNLRFLTEMYEKPIILHNRLGTGSTVDHDLLRETLLAIDSIRDVQYEGVKLTNYILLNDEEIRINPVAVHSPLVEGLKHNELVIPESLADQYQLQEGEEITIGYFDVEHQEVLPVGKYRIGRISEELSQTGYTLMTWSNPLNIYTTVDRIYIDTDDEQQALAELESIRTKFPEFKITALSEALKHAREGFMQRWGIFIVVLSVVIGCSLAGVLSGLMNQILSKRKEFAILRTVGVPPKGITTSIMVQVCLYVGIGIVFGSILGVIILVLVLALDPTPITFHLPTIGLASIVMILLTIITFTITGYHITRRNIPREITIDG